MRGNRNAKHRGTQCQYNGLRMDSTWEMKVAAYLDQQGMEWRYEERAYELDEKRSYRPDFHIYKDGEFVKLIEVKGYWRKENLAKFQEFQSKYPEVPVEVWDKKILKNLGLI